MSLPFEPPASRRAMREWRASGEQPTVTGPVAEAAEPVGEAVAAAEAPMTRRRLRELRETGMMPTVAAEVPLETAPVRTVSVPPATESVPPAALPAEATFPPSAPSGWTGEAPVAEPVDPSPEAESEPPSEPAPAAWDEPAPPTPTGSYVAPEGHWTRQLTAEDELETTVSREVGGSPAPTTSVIVIDAPPVVDLGGPLNATGEVLLTGSIPLDHAFATTGAIGRLSDGADEDDAFDALPHAEAGDDAPVRASAVASQHALGTPIVTNARRRGTGALTGLLVGAVVLTLLVIGFVVAAVIFEWI